MKHFCMILKWRSFWVLFSVVFAWVSTALAEPIEITEKTLTKSSNTHIYLAGGSALTNPNSDFSQTVDSFTAQGGRVNTVGVIEAPGIFRKKTDQLWVGVLPSLIAEEYSGNYLQTTSLALSHFNLDVSAIWFLEPKINRGFLGRVDLGYTYLHEYDRVNGVSNDSYYNGANLKISGGYALPCFGDDSFWSFNLGLFGVTAGAFNETGVDITVGVML